MMRRIVLLVLLMSISGVMLAQDPPRYEDPAGRFTAPVPEGWGDSSTAEMAHFVSETPPAEVMIVALNTAEVGQALAEALTQLAPDVEGDPLQETAFFLNNGYWTQQVYLAGSDVVVLVGRVRDDYTVVLLARGGQLALSQINEALVGIIQSIEFPVTPPPDYADTMLFVETDVMVDTLPGTLTMPTGEGPFPALIIVHGSGPGDRDGNLHDLYPYRDLAVGLASRGVAVLRYDKRTGVHPDEYSESFTVDEEVIDDVLLAVELLHTTDGVDPDRVYVLGHSLGGMLAPRIAAGKPDDIAGLIILAGNVRPLQDLIVEQTYYLAELDGEIDPAEGQQIEAIEEAVAQIEMLAEGDEVGFLLGAPPLYWLDLRAYDPVAMAQTLEMPMLILQGERDYQVTMEDFELWRTGLSARDNVTFISYPTLNHNMMAGEGLSSPEEYAIQSYVDIAVIEDIAAWINSHK